MYYEGIIEYVKTAFRLDHFPEFMGLVTHFGS